MTTTQEPEARLQNLLDISNAQRNAAMSDWHRLEAELIKERANSALLLEACKLWIKYDSADENAFQLLMMNYANALNATKAAIKQAEEIK